MNRRASMNHIFRSVWNASLGVMVAVAEIATAASGAASSANAQTVVASNVAALPTGGVVIQGGASFNTSTTGATSKLTVTTTNGAGSNHSAINWNTFNIGAGNTTQFVQPDANSLSINRVVTNTPSQLFGTLSSNGKLVLVNQSGIAVGAGAFVDTAGFTAAAMGMSEANAKAGILKFDSRLLSNGGGNGANSLVNPGVNTITIQGNLIARGGDVVLIAPSIELAKTAIVESQGGSAILAAGQSVEITGRGLEGIKLQVQAPADQAINLGTLKGDAVGIFAGTLKHSGSINATQATLVNGQGGQGGKVVLKAQDLLEVDGSINATSSNGTGGSIQATANKVWLKSNTHIDASGATGGGEVLIGGGWQGHDASVSNAQRTSVSAGASIKADATDNGNGGTVVVWADGLTRYTGHISAKGGANGGNGGNVEVSGKQQLDFLGSADVTAARGASGLLLLDPNNITIGTVADLNGDAINGDDVTGSYTSSGDSKITATAVGTLLNSGNLTLTAGNDITVNNAITKTGGSGSTLTLTAGNQVAVKAPIASTASAPLILAATGSFITTSASGSISTNGGNVNLNATAGGVAANGNITTNGGNVVLAGTGAAVNASGAISSGGGTITLFSGSGGSVTNTGTLSSVGGVITLNANGGSANMSNNVNAGSGDINIRGDSGINLAGNLNTSGNLLLNSSVGSGNINQTSGKVVVGGNTNINANGGDIFIGLQNGNDFNTMAVSTSGNLAIEDANALTVLSFSFGGSKSLYFQAGGALTLPAGAITTTGDITLSTGAAFTTPGALTGNQISLTGFTGVAIAHNLTASGALSLTTNFGPGNISQSAGKVITAGGLTSIQTNGNANSVLLNQPNNDFNILTVTLNTPANPAGSVTIVDKNSIALGDIVGTSVSVTAAGAITYSSGAVDTSAANGPITLSGNSLGSTGTPLAVTPGNGSVSLTSAQDIFVSQAFGSMNLGNYTVSAPKVGAIIQLSNTAVGVNTQVDFAGFNANTNDDVIKVLSTSSGSNIHVNGGVAATAADLSISALGAGSSVYINDANLNAATLAYVSAANGDVQLGGTVANNLGALSVAAGGSVSGSSGALRTYGTSITVRANANGGSFTPTGSGSIGLDTVVSKGADGVNSVNPSIATGKSGGPITLSIDTGSTGGTSVTTVDSRGGNGASNVGATDNGMPGGKGGSILIDSHGPSFVLNVGSVNSSGGKGGNASLIGKNGGSGGAGGDIDVYGPGGNLTFGGGNILARGGDGGNAILNAAPAAAGAAGAGGGLEITALTNLAFAGATSFNIYPGSPGLDNAGVQGSGLGIPEVLLKAGVGSSITQTASGIISAPGQIVKVQSGNNITLTESSNQFGEMNGTAGGNAFIWGLYGIGDAGMTAGGSMQLVSATGNPLYIQGPLVASGMQLSGNSIKLWDFITTTGGLSMGSSGTVDQLASGADLTVGGLLNINAPSQAVNLIGTNNHISSLEVVAASVDVKNNQALALANLTVDSARINTSGANGAITQVGGTSIVANNNVDLSSGSGSIVVTQPGNSLNFVKVTSTGAVNLLNGANPLGLDTITAGTLNVVGGGNVGSDRVITTTSGEIALRSTAGAIQLAPDGSATLNSASQIVLQAQTNLGVQGVSFTTGTGGNLALISTAGNLSGGFATLNLGAGGVWQTYLTNAGNTAFAGVFAPANAAYKQVNAVYGPAPLGSGNGSLFSANPVLSGSLTGSVSKIYDGNTSISLAGAGVSGVTGLLFGETIGTLTGGTGTLASPNAGKNINVTASGLVLTGVTDSFGKPTYGYLLPSASGNIGNVEPVFVSAAISLNGTRVYDGSADVNANIFSMTGLVNGETLGLTGSGTVPDKNVGVNKPVTLGSLTLQNGSGVGGGLASNYTFTGGTQVATITAAPISAVSGITANNKVYDGNVTATVVSNAAQFSGMVVGDTLSVATASGAFTDKNAGVGKTVNITGITLSGASVGNYQLVNSSSSATADIGRASINTVSGITANNKVYDGTTQAVLNTGAPTFNGMVPGDVLTVANATGNFSDKNAASGKTVSIAGITLAGVDSGNYTLANTSAQTRADITVRPLATFTGAAGANWSNTANWDALPDGTNVQAVAIPAGAGSVVFDAGSTSLQSFSSARPVLVAGGNLSFGSTVNVTSLSQTGGSVSGSGGLNVSDSFNQTGGTMVLAGPANINQASGRLTVGNLSAPSIRLTSPTGGILQTGVINTGSLDTTSLNGTNLGTSTNQVALFKAVNTGSGDIVLNNQGVLNVAGVSNVGGNLIITNVGGVTTTSRVSAPNGFVSVIANSPLTIGSEGVDAGGDITLTASNLTSAGNMRLDGPVTSGGVVNLTAAGNLTQNSTVLGAKGVNASVGGQLVLGADAVSGNSPVTYSNNGNVLNPPRRAPGDVLAQVATDSVATLLAQAGKDLVPQPEEQALANPDGSFKHKTDGEAIVSDGETCRP